MGDTITESRKTNVGWIIGRIILILLLIVNLIVIAMSGQFGTTALSKLPFSVIPILSDSMAPVIESGDAVLVKQESFDNIIPGDIVVFQSDGDLIIHEVIDRDEESLYTKGLDNDILDLPVEREYYRAKYVFRIPLLGGIWRISGNPVKFVLLAVLVGLIIFGDQIFSSLYTRFLDKSNAGEPEDNSKVGKE